MQRRSPKSHNIEALVDLLSQHSPTRAKLEALGPLTAYATAFRYPGLDQMSLPEVPGQAEIEAWLQLLSDILRMLRQGP